LITILVKQYDVVLVTALSLVLMGVFVFVLIILFLGLSLFSFTVLLFLLGITEGVIWWLYNKGLETVGASLTTIVYSTIPFFTLLFSFIYNIFNPWFFILPQNLISVIIGGVLMFCGIVVVNWNDHLISS